MFKSLLIGTCENDKNSCDLSLVDLLQQVCHIDHNQESKSLWLDWIFTLGWERASILSQSSSPWSSKTMLLIPVSAFFVKIPSVSISLAVGGFGGISVLRYLYSVLSHCRWVGICWQNSRRSFSSVMPLRTSLSASSWISFTGRRGSWLIAIFTFSWTSSLSRFARSSTWWDPSFRMWGPGSLSISGYSSSGFKRLKYRTRKKEVHPGWLQ